MIKNTFLNYIETLLFILPCAITDYIYIKPHFNAFIELFNNNTKIINKNQTFLIIGGALYPRTFKVLKKLGVSNENIVIWDSCIKNIQKTKYFFPTINIVHKRYDSKSIIEYDNVILPLAFSTFDNDYINQKSYNIIIHDYVSIFYNNPLITYYNIYFGMKKLSFIPSNNNYKIESVKLNNTLTNLSCYIIKNLTNIYIPFIISLYTYIYPPPDNVNLNNYSTLNDYFLREININQEINNNKLIMPCCGIIKDTGKLKDNILFTKIKNEDILIKSSNFLMYINIFIRPNDYHYIHSPINGKITYIGSYNGNRSILNQHKILKLNKSIIENTKIIMLIENNTDKVMIIMIGGMFVGSIQLFIKENMNVNIGEKLGYFNFGSSILLLHNNLEFIPHINSLVKI